MAGRSILLIDDDEDDQEIFLVALQEVSKDIHCDTFSRGAEALDKLTRNVLHPEVIFLDLNMPVMDGRQLLSEIRKHKELMTIPIVVYSTSSDTRTIQAVKDLGAADFLTKPESVDALASQLKVLLNQPVKSL
jgi:CheY-like chemotaxis protein